MNDCIFCKIIKGDIPAHKVYEDDEVLAFLDARPVHPGHTLLMPKRHVKSVLDMPPKEAGMIFSRLPHIARAVKEGAGADGINIIINNDQSAGQIVFHAHIHIIPRSKDDGLTHWKGAPYPSDAATADMAARIMKSFPAA